MDDGGSLKVEQTCQYRVTQDRRYTLELALDGNYMFGFDYFFSQRKQFGSILLAYDTVLSMRLPT